MSWLASLWRAITGPSAAERAERMAMYWRVKAEAERRAKEEAEAFDKMFRERWDNDPEFRRHKLEMMRNMQPHTCAPTFGELYPHWFAELEGSNAAADKSEGRS